MSHHERPDLEGELPYRPCAGMAVFNREGLVFLGRLHFGPGNLLHVWQMPQGGIDAGETPLEAARRELHEETSIRSVSPLGEVEEWLRYDVPAPLRRFAWKGRYRGQEQKWLALRFEGEDSEINVKRAARGHTPEYRGWRWERLERIPKLIAPFQRPIYARVAEAFARYAKPDG